MGGNRARGSWEQTQGQTQSQTQHKQRPQATAEQIRLAQMISDHNDADFEEKVKQVNPFIGILFYYSLVLHELLGSYFVVPCGDYKHVFHKKSTVLVYEHQC
ncbi:hypothetical protein XENORESO_013272 [Xenotaenia resolanae]|uniref:Uncharacterized protein n=1 Tax=Xenotaenia resolanae TaxID=208358 RepID=A0ABV0WLQ3_9TELE